MPKKAGRRQKKGETGTAAIFITRNQVLKKLQITLPEFRKLCILKGIYPREPKKVLKGKDKTYYLKKDILYLQHDPIIATFRARTAWKKKAKKAKSKGETAELALLKERKPRYSLNHIVRERYPTFVDALRDMDDPLCLAFLFARMPSDIRIHTTRIEHCRRLAQEFQYYVYKTNSLRKVFVSIKGIYYQADILGQTVTWLVPHQFTQTTVKNVDYKVMLSFLEFYELLLSFINFKLYSVLEITYPPTLNKLQVSKGSLLSAVQEAQAAKPAARITTTTTKVTTTTAITATTASEEKTKVTPHDAAELKKQQETSLARLASLGTVLGSLPKNNKEEDDDDEEDSDEESEEIEEDSDEDSEEEEVTKKPVKKAQKKESDVAVQQDEAEKKESSSSSEDELDVFANDDTSILRRKQEVYSTLFSKCIFWLGREVPKESLEFVILSFGGKVHWDGGALKENDPSITHQIVDRPRLLSPEIESREYVQPQWVYDSINTRLLIPCHDYGVGKALPPHLSPFVDDVVAGYVPEYKLKLDEYYNKEYGESLLAGQEIPVEISEESDDEEEFANDMEAEKQGNYVDTRSAGVKRKRSARADKEEEERDQSETAAALLPKKKRKALESMKRRKRMHEGSINKLEDKKLKLASGEAFINATGVIEYK